MIMWFSCTLIIHPKYYFKEIIFSKLLPMYNFYLFRIMGDHINTYTFTKALAEHVVNDARNIIRTCIVRPSMSM